MSLHFRQRRSVLLGGPGSGRGRGRGLGRGVITPCLVGLCAVLAIAAACLLATLLLLQHQFRPRETQVQVRQLDAQMSQLSELSEQVQRHELWAMERVREGLNVSDASLEDMVSWLLRQGERLQAARLILEDHRRATAAAAAATTATTSTESPARTTTPEPRPELERSADAEPIEEVESIALPDNSLDRATDEEKPPWMTDLRLAEDVRPQRYDLLLHPSLEDGALAGKVSITLRVGSPRKDLWLHAYGMHINSVELDLVRAESDEPGPEEELSCARSPGRLKVDDTLLWPATQFLVVHMECLLVPGVYDLHVSFSGSLLSEGRGLFRTSYLTSSNVTRYLATSKFEPTYARLAFPCFDEPAMKASYKVRLVRPSSEGYIALSNSDVKSETVDPNTKLTTVEFTETVKMSSYLAVFIVCDFVKQDQSVNMTSGQPVNVYTREDQKSNAVEALTVAKNVVEFYAEYFKIPYPMPKIDLIAIPDFVSGAMENWGLITFRETSILFDPKENSPVNQESISETVAHELAHMWFGNLVTMKWWTDLWLNEGFATFMAQKGVNQMHVDWDYTNQFVVDTLLSVLKLDAELSSHPVLQEVSNPDQITEIFDTISYDKGSSVILMLEAIMGEESFKRGLNTYLKTHLYSNAETADLWKALQDYAEPNVNIAKVMDTWTRQMGFPLVSVNKTAPGKFTLTQKRFLSNAEAKFDPSESKYGYKWEIPLYFSTSKSNVSKLHWLPSDKESVDISVDDPNIEWIKFNHNQRSYYRVMYDSEGWKNLINALTENVTQIDAVDRAGLISDAFSLADAEVLDYTIALNLSNYLILEESYVPWNAASTAIDTLSKHLPDSDALKRYGVKLVRPIVNKLSWDTKKEDSHLTNRLRSVVLGLACSLKDKEALDQANMKFQDWLQSDAKPDPTIRSVVYRYGLGNSEDENQWNRLFEKFMVETNTQEKVKLMYALATTPNQMLLQRYLEAAKNESIIRSQDYFTVLQYIADNPKGLQLVWDFYRNEYDYLVKRFSLNDRIFGRFIARIASRFDTQEKLDEIKDFFSKHPDAGAGAAARKQALEKVANNIKWIKTHRETVENWLKNNL